MNINYKCCLLLCGLIFTAIPSVCTAQTLHRGVVTKSFTEPIERSIVASSENGVVKTVRVREGDQVRAGDQLAELNHGVLLQSKRQAEARANSTAKRDAAKSRYRMVMAQKQTLEGLIAEGHVNKYELQQKTTEYNNAAAEYREAEDELVMNQIEVDRIEAQIQERIIMSPIDGVVVKIHKQPGEHVSNNEPQYATIVRIDKLKSKFYLKADVLNRTRVGETVNVYVGADRRKLKAQVAYVSPVIDPDSGTGRIEVEIDNANQALQSGTICVWGDGSGSASDKQRTRAANASFSK